MLLVGAICRKIFIFILYAWIEIVQVTIYSSTISPIFALNQAEWAGSHGVFVVQLYAFVSFLFSIMDAKVLLTLFTTLAVVVVGQQSPFCWFSCSYLESFNGAAVSWLTLIQPTIPRSNLRFQVHYTHRFRVWTSVHYLDFVLLRYPHPCTTRVGRLFTRHEHLWRRSVRDPLRHSGLVLCRGHGAPHAYVGTYCLCVACHLTLFHFHLLLGHDQDLHHGDRRLAPKDVVTLSPVLSLLVLASAVAPLLMFSYHATYVSSMAYSSPSIVIYAGRTSDGRRVTFTTTKYSSWLQNLILVGLRLSDVCYCQSHCPSRQQHLEQHPHRHCRPSSRHHRGEAPTAL